MTENMKYKDAAYLSLITRTGSPVGQFVEARAFDAVHPGKLKVNAGGTIQTTPKGMFSEDFQGIDYKVGVPVSFVSFMGPFNWSTRTGNVAGGDLVVLLYSEWTFDDLKKIVGSENYAFAKAMRSLYKDKIKGKRILTPEQETLFDAATDYGMLPKMWKKPAELEGSEAWNKTVEELDNIWTKYLRISIADGQKAVEESAAAVARWEAIYASVKFVAELPSTIVATVAKGTGFIGWQLLKSNPILVIGALAVVFIMFAPKIQAAIGMAKGAAKRAKGVADAVKG
jgi:hypothetical protein